MAGKVDNTGDLGENRGTMTPGTKSKREISGGSTAKRAMKGIRHGAHGRNLEDTEHNDRMGHSCEEY